MSLIEISGLGKDYENGMNIAHVLKNINLRIEKGDFTALVGPSGSGKTTLLNIIGCLDTCTNGKIIINGKNVTNISNKDRCRFRRENLGFVFQSYNLIPVLTAFENVEYPLIIQKMPASRRRKLCENILEKVGLKDKLHSYPNEMSGGQQQRVSIARALVSSPELVLADEPTANLDSVSGCSIVKLLQELNHDSGVTVLFSTHDPTIMKYSRKVIHLTDGKIVDEK